MKIAQKEIKRERERKCIKMIEMKYIKHNKHNLALYNRFRLRQLSNITDSYTNSMV